MKNAIIKDIIYDNEKEKLVIILDNKDYYYTDLSQNQRDRPGKSIHQRLSDGLLPEHGRA